jgi:hypothetical protein
MIITIKEIAAALGVRVRAAQHRAAKESWPFSIAKVRGGDAHVFTLETLPADVCAAVDALRARATAYAERVSIANGTKVQARIALAWADFEPAAGWRRKIAELRQSALIRVGELVEQGRTLEDARFAVADTLRLDGFVSCGASALKRWGRTVKDIPRSAWLPLLLPDERGRPLRTSIHRGAWDAFKVDFLRLEQPTLESCYRRLNRLAAQRPDWLPLPSLKTFKRRLAEEIPLAARVLARKGEEALERMGPKIARDRSDLAALEAVTADGHKFDVAVLFPDGSTGRPIIVGWQDIASGKLLSYRIGKTETADVARLSFCDMVERYGIPAHAFLDNGRAFAAKQNTGGTPTRYRYKVRAEDPAGVLTRLGTRVHWVTPYNGKAKPIERTWADFARDISKRPEFAGAYLGNSPDNKPENYGSRAVPWDEFVRVVADGIAEHNAREGRRSKVCDGRSFDATFADLYACATITKATQAQLSMLLLASDVFKVHNGTGEVHFAGNRYWSEELCEHQGEQVELRFDPEALHAGVHAFTLGGDVIGYVSCIGAFGHGNTDQLRAAIQRKKDFRKKHRDYLRAREAFEFTPAAAALPAISEPPRPIAGVVRLHTTKGKMTAATHLQQPAAQSPLSEFDLLFLERAKRNERAQ